MKKTTTETELRRMVESGMTHAEIAKTLGRHTSAVSSTLALLGIRSPSGLGALHEDGHGQHDLQAYMADMRVGMSLAEIAAEHGKDRGAIFQALRRAGLPTCTRILLKQEYAAKAAATAPGRFDSFLEPLAA